MLHALCTPGRKLLLLASVALTPAVLTGQPAGSARHDLTGIWIGRMTHGTDAYTREWEITLTLKQNASRVTGTTRLDFREYFAVFALSGTYRGGTLTAAEGRLLDQGAGSVHWCMGRTLQLEPVSTDRLRGRWRSATPGCSDGVINVERCHDPRARTADRARAERLASASGHTGDAARTFVTEYLKLQEAHRALEHSRDQLTRSRDFVHAFGALYSHAIRLTLERFDRGEATSPDELVLDNAFYDAWAFNLGRFATGGANAVEPHWRVYFTLAETYGSGLHDDVSRAGRFAALMTAGIRAHIDGDLPRAIRHVLAELPADRQRALAADFRASDPVFEAARARFLDEAATSIYPSTPRALLEIGAMPLQQINDPVTKRADAWRLGADRHAPLQTGGLAQPVYGVARICAAAYSGS